MQVSQLRMNHPAKNPSARRSPPFCYIAFTPLADEESNVWQSNYQGGVSAVTSGLTRAIPPVRTPAPVICVRNRRAAKPWYGSADVDWTGQGGPPSAYRSADISSRAFCARCGSSLGAIDDAPTVALLSGVFDQQEDTALMPTSHSFEDMKPGWWRKLCPDAMA